MTVKLVAETDIKNEVVTCSFLFFRGVPEQELHFRAGDYYFPITFIKRSRSEEISLRRQDSFGLYREVLRPDHEESDYESLATAKLPSHIHKVLFLVISPQDGNKHYRFLVLDDSTEIFPGSAFLFVNLSGMRLRVDFGGESPSIEVDEALVLGSKVGEKGGFVPCTIYDESGDKYYENRLYSQQTARKIVIIGAPKNEGGVPRIELVEQLLPQLLSAPAAQQ
ncbi:MAG: hypothetical protein ACPIG6_11250 [Akkermansiaceae bacterium]